MRRPPAALLVGLVVVAAGILLAQLKVNSYYYFAGYVVLQYVVIATAWNILGGYAGYVNFGTPAFFAMGAYTAVVLIKWTKAPLPVLLLAGGLVAALLGLGIGYLTLRLRGTFFSIATLALSVVLQTVIMNWEYVGGSRGISVPGHSSCARCWACAGCSTKTVSRSRQANCCGTSTAGSPRA